MVDEAQEKTDFAANVQTIVGPTLAHRGFTLDEIKATDEGGRTGVAVFYRNQVCKLQVYWSAREREINCMMAPLDAPNEHGLYDNSRNWHYLNDFVPVPDLPLEELVKQLRAERSNFESETKWLAWIAIRIDRFYESALAGIRQLNASE